MSAWGVEPAQESAQEVEPPGVVAVVLVRGEKRHGWARVWRVIRSAARKLMRSGSCPQWVAAWVIRDRIA